MKIPTKNSTVKYTLLVCAYLCIIQVGYSQDVNVQHIQHDIVNAQTTAKTTGFTAVSDINSAFILANNNRKVNAGSDGVSSAYHGDDLAGARVLTGTGTVTYYRHTGSTSDPMRFNSSIWEYTGALGGNNEFIVRSRHVVLLAGTTISTTEALSGVVDAEKCIAFITGIRNSGASQDADSGTAIAYLSDSSTLNILKGSNANNVNVYITVVEFTGSNWTVLHGDSASTAADTGTITLNDDEDGNSGDDTSVSHWDQSIIFSHHIGDTGDSGTNDARADNWPLMTVGSDDQSVDWTFHSNHDSAGTNRHFVHVLNNPDLNVTRFSDSQNAADESTIDITSAGLTNVNKALIIGSSITNGTNAYYARGWRNYYLNSITEAAHWSHRSGNTLTHQIQIVDLAALLTPTVATNGPAGITTDLEMWLKADVGTTGSPVTAWADQSGFSNDVTQNAGAAALTNSAMNFNPALTFTGSEGYLTPSFTSAQTYAVVKLTGGASDGNYYQIIGKDNGGGSVERVLGVRNSNIQASTGAWAYPYATSNVTIDGLASTVTCSVSTDHLITANVGTAGSVTDNFHIGELSTGSSWSNWQGEIAEIISYSTEKTGTDVQKIESYLAIKYGITLDNSAGGIVGDYIDSNGTTIWDASENSTFHNNVTGIGQDDASELNQKQSKSSLATNDGTATDDITIGIINIAATNSANTNTFLDDDTFLMWGNNNGTITATTDITKDFSSSMAGVTSSVSATPISRIWKFISKDSVPSVKISIPEAMVSATNPGSEDYIMIIADDASFTTNVTSATMAIVGSDLEVDFFIKGTKYITFGSAPEVAIGERSVYFDNYTGVTGTSTYLSAGDVNDLDNTDFTISAWVRRDTGEDKFDVVSKRNYFNENTAADPGADNDGTYNHGYAFRINQFGQFRMVWRDPADGSNQSMQTSATIPENEWHHIAATFNVGTNMCRLYIDGLLEDEDDGRNPINVGSDAHFMIGAAHHIYPQQKMRGSIDEVRVWNVTLSANQIRYIMNQEIEENATLADGKILPATTTKNDIDLIPWNNLIAYYPMSTMVFGSIKDESNSGNDMSMINFTNLDEQTAPLPYKTTGTTTDWDTDTTWENGDVQYLPGVVSYLAGGGGLTPADTTIDYNIVQIDDDVTMTNDDTSLIPASKNGNRTLLGLVVNSDELKVDGDTGTNTGYGLTVSHYLKIDGKIDLEGESQLIQPFESDFDTSSTGTLERDQQGVSDTYTYNYWSSPVAPTSNSSYALPDIFTNVSFSSSRYDGEITPTDTINADYWIWKYANKPSDTYTEWQHVRSSPSLSAGEGFTMKGPGASSSNFNYIFEGQPNNGDFSLSITAGNDYLVGNPYPSAMDADEFIKDNISDSETNGRNPLGNVINGVLYFWDDFAPGSHHLADYRGGYATYTLMGGAVAINNDSRINADSTPGVTTPQRYIPVGQGFFVSAIEDIDLNNDGVDLDMDLEPDPDPNDPDLSDPIIGGQLLFKNSQRVFQKEDPTESIFLKSKSTKKQSENKNEDTDSRQKIRLMFDSPDGYHRQLLVGADENATSNYDMGYDAPLIENNKEDMYWNINNAKFIIQAVNNFNEDQTLSLGITIVKDGIATLKIDDLENIDDNFDVFVHDKELNVYHNLKTNDYEVFLTTGEYSDRFEIAFTNNSLGTDDFENEYVQVYFSNDQKSVVVHNPKHTQIESIKIYNMLGQLVFESNTKTTKSYIEFKNIQIQNSAYIIKLKTEENSITKKILTK